MNIAGPRPTALRRALTLHLPMLAIVLFALGPYLWMLITSVRPEATLFSPQRTLLPEALTPANYLRLFTKTSFIANLGHSLVVALGTVALGLALSLTAAYAFSRYRFAGRRMLMMSFLLINMFPIVLLIIPLFITMRVLGILDTHLALILAHSTFSIPFATWMMTSYFDAIPRSLDEAAMVDGCTALGAMVKVVLPLAMPGVIATGIYIFITSWKRPFTAAHFPQFARLRAAGFDFVELLVPEPGELDLTATRRALNDEGLGVALAARVNLDRNLCADDEARRRAGRDYLRYCVEVAHALGAGVAGGPLYGNPLVFAARAPHPVDEALRQRREAWCVEGLREAAPIAAAANVKLGVEPLNRFETDILNTTRQGVALMGLIDHDAIGLVLDTFHMNMEDDDIVGAIRAAGRHLIHFQANENHRGHLGSGHIDWTAVVRALADIDFRGWITLEPFRRSDERIGIPFAQWKPPARDEQPELAAAYSFLRNLLHLNGARA